MAKITRSQLYERVWNTPMTKLSAEFGLSDQGLAKLCARHAIPRPSRGYWAKKNAGIAVGKVALPAKPNGVSENIDIRPSTQAHVKGMEVRREQAKLSKAIVPPTIPKDMRDLHPIVAAWVREHKEAQVKRLAKVKAARRDDWFKPEPIGDLTERDQYRFRVTSALLEGLELAGGKVLSSRLRGELSIECHGQAIEMKVVEKMRQDFAQKWREGPCWTAYPDHHNAALGPTGYLRFSVSTYFGGGHSKEWIESPKLKAPALLPEVIAGLLAIGAALIDLERRREEASRIAEEARRAEEKRRIAAQQEAARWKRFQDLSDAWHQAVKLRAFLAELERQQDTLNPQIDGMPLEDWLTWARTKIDELDPFSSGKNDP